MPRPTKILVATDLVVLTVRDSRLQVLTIERGADPHRGRTSLPGGFVRPTEDLLDAAERELAEETGLSGIRIHLEQLASYGHPDRDPRRVISIAYLALIPDAADPVAGTDAVDASWTPVTRLLSAEDALAFDHDRILSDGVERARSKLEYSPLATAFCPGEFTIGELRQVYEAVWDTEIDPRNFHRKVSRTPGFVVETGGTTTRQGGRPAKLYRRGSAKLLHPPMLRP